MKAPALKDKADKADPDKAGLEKLPKAKLIAMILEQREDARIRLEAKDQQITELSEQLAKLQEKIDKKKARQKIKDINQQVNQPTSKNRNGTRTATRNRQQLANRKSAKREPAAATGENPTSPQTRQSSSP